MTQYGPPTPDNHWRYRVPNIDWEHPKSLKWDWPSWKLGYKQEDLFNSLYAEFNCMPVALQSERAWFYDVHEISSASNNREEFKTALRKRRDERFNEILKAWDGTTLDLCLNRQMWERPEMDKQYSFLRFTEMASEFTFETFLAYFVLYLPENRAPMPIHPPEQSQQPDQPQPDERSGQEDEPKAQLRRYIQGLINILTRENMTVITERMTYLYLCETDARQLITSTLIDLVITYLCSPNKRVDLFFAVIAGFIASMHKTMGIPHSAQFVGHFVEAIVKHSTTVAENQSSPEPEHLDSTPCPSPPPPAKMRGKARATREKTNQRPVRNGRVEKPPPKRRTAKNSTPGVSGGPRRSARLQQRAARGKIGG